MLGSLSAKFWTFVSYTEVFFYLVVKQIVLILNFPSRFFHLDDFIWELNLGFKS